MDAKGNKVNADKKIKRLETVIAKLKRARSVTDGLLQLSELAYKVHEISEFYPKLQEAVASAFQADNFYVVLQNHESLELELVYFRDEMDSPTLPKIKGFESGITGYVFRSGETLLCDKANYRQLVEKKRFLQLGSEPEFWFGVPLKQGDRTIGVMAIQSYTREIELTDQQVSLFEHLGLHLMTAIERVSYRESLEREVKLQTYKLQQEVQQRKHAEKLQEALFRISELSGSNVPMEHFYQQIHQILGELMKVENCYIAMIDGETLAFPFYVDKYNPVGKTRKLSKGLTEFVIETQKPQLIDVQFADHLIATGMLARLKGELHHSTCWLGAPLIVNEEVIGVLSVQAYDHDYEYCHSDLQLLTFVSHHIATAIGRKHAAEALIESHAALEQKVSERTAELRDANDNLKLQIEQRKLIEQKLFHQANHDLLTDLPNRALFRTKLEQCLQHVKRHNDHHYAVLFIDLDNFKQINDQFGHQVGDRFLIEASERIVSSVRENDVVARFGGDEFVILLDLVTDIRLIEEIAKRIISKMSAPFVLNEFPTHSGASIGIRAFGQTPVQVDELLKQADDAMYQAKEQGRGCFVFYQQQPKNFELNIN